MGTSQGNKPFISERKEEKINMIAYNSTNLIKLIKSLFIVKKVFLNLPEKKKLNLIINNKSLQTKVGLDIEDYKKISGKYLEGDRNGYRKEYLLETRELVFEGEYLNGKRNGIGIEYYSDIIIEGKYLNGKIIGKKVYDKENNMLMRIEENGEGEEYYKNGKLLFKGEYFNLKKWSGVGYNITGNKEFEIKYGKDKLKEYNRENNILLFEGEYLNGKRNGIGKEFYNNGKIKFEGEYLNGKRNGKGK
jgi:antitoxin component YwqK of YwqJK toxin-antitoxin module